jgi:hypothetical protein
MSDTLPPAHTPAGGNRVVLVVALLAADHQYAPPVNNVSEVATSKLSNRA